MSERMWTVVVVAIVSIRVVGRMPVLIVPVDPAFPERLRTFPLERNVLRNCYRISDVVVSLRVIRVCGKLTRE